MTSTLHDPGLPMTTWRNIYIAIDNGRAPPAAYAAPEAEMIKLAQRYGNNCGCLVVLPADATQPPEEARRAINGCLERQAPIFKGVAWVVEGRGFASAMVRATLTTMGFARRRLQTWKVVTSVDEGLGWLVSRTTTSTTVDLQDGVRAVAGLR